MNKFILISSLIIIAIFSLFSRVFAESHIVEVTEGGTTQSYEIALDEIYLPQKGLKAVDPQKSVESLKEFAQSIMVTTKESVFLVLYPHGATHTERNRRILTDEILVEANPSAAAEVAKMKGVDHMESLDFAPNFYKVVVTNPMLTLSTAERIREVNGVKTSEAQFASYRIPRAVPNDPFYSTQWHLKNTGQKGGLAGIDVNAEPVWDKYRGIGQVIGILDTGVDITHEDLAPAINTSLSYDFNGNDTNPSPVLAEGSSSFHGTACAGVAAARGFNSKGVVGVAPGASIAAIRLIAQPITDITEAKAMTFQWKSIGIKSNSWGPGDPFMSPGTLTKAAIQNSVTNGRGGRGTIFLFAAGNDALSGDNSNYDGYTNSIYTVAVGAINDKGTKSSYSEAGANLIVVAPSNDGGNTQGITTTDITGPNGYNNAGGAPDEPANKNYTSSFGGTSSACPAVAGVVALMLQANPQLTWRDVQNILIRTAKKNDASDPEWVTNGAGLHFNDKYGAGLVNAAAAVALAKSAPLLAAQITTIVNANGLPKQIPDKDSDGITVTIPVASTIKSLEHVVAEVSCNHPYRGDLKIVLKSPSGTSSVLAEVRSDNQNNYQAWPFMTARNWGEPASGNWILKMTDEVASNSGSLTGVKLKLYGTTTPGGSGSQNPPPSDVKCTIASSKNEAGTRIVKVSGTASSASSEIARVEYQKGIFGSPLSPKTMHSNHEFLVTPTGAFTPLSSRDNWTKAHGTTSWSFQAQVPPGQIHFLVRAVGKNGAVSNIQTVTVLVK